MQLTVTLSQQQQWGIAYLVQLCNAEAAIYNASLPDRNRFIPRDEPLLEERPLLDNESYILRRILEIANQGYSELISFKEQEALRMFRAKSPEEQEAIVKQLQIPDVLKEPV